MKREPNTDAYGQSFRPEIIEAVWQKAQTMRNYATLRVDTCGWTIVRQEYGNTRSRYGWEIDHIVPVSGGGSDDLGNLQPLQWENNRRKDEGQFITSATQPAEMQPKRSSQSAPHSPRSGRK